MNRDQIIERLRHHLDEIVPGEAADLAVDADLRDELDLDSMDFLHVVRAVHEELETWKRQMDIELYEDTDLFSARPRDGAPKGPTGLSPEGRERLKTGPGDSPKIDLGTGRPEGFVSQEQLIPGQPHAAVLPT